MLLQQQLRDLGAVTDDHIDMTAMVDVVFQLLTFLLLTYQVSAESAVNMPPAVHGIGVDETEALVLTVVPPAAAGSSAGVYAGTKIDPEQKLDDDEAIREATEIALTLGKNRVVIQADGDVPHGEVLRIAGAVARVEGITVHIGVEEVK
jgi:biopolymer transport protein ExbD